MMICELIIYLMKYRIAIITYLVYACLHLMRTAFPFVQYNIAQYYGTDEKYIGILAAATYIIMGIGYLFRNLFLPRRIVHSYFIEGSLCAIFYLLIPISMLFNFKSLVFGVICYGLYGLFQSGLFVTLTTLMGQHFSSEKDGTLLGFWSSTSDFGNIAGYFISTIIIYYIHASFEWPLIIASILTLIITFVMKIGIPEPQIFEQREKSVKKCFGEIADYFKQTDNALYALIILFLGAGQYGILLWLPMYLQENKYEDFQGYISMTYSACNLIGGTIIGSCFQLTAKRRRHFLAVFLALCFGILALSLIYVFRITPEHKWYLLFLVGCLGLSIGGSFNVYTGIEMIKQQYESENTLITGNIINGFINFMIGILQFILGIISSEDSHSIFIVFIIVTGISAIFVLIRLVVTRDSSKRPLHEIEELE